MLASRPAKAQVKDDTDSCLHVPKETLRISMDSDEHPRLHPMGLAVVMCIPMTSRNKNKLGDADTSMAIHHQMGQSTCVPAWQDGKQ